MIRHNFSRPSGLTIQIGLTYAFAFIVLIPATGCGAEPDRNGRVFTDDAGRQVVVEGPIERVVTLAPSLTEVVFAAGSGSRLVGVGQIDDYPPAVDTLPRYATYPLDFEAVAALNPDLAFATDQVNSMRDAATLDGLGIPTYFLSFRTLEDVFDGIATVGRILGTPEAADSAADSLRRGVGDVRAVTENVEHRPRVLFIIGRETLFSFGSESYVHEMIEAAGGESITAEFETAAPDLSEEYVLSRMPDVIMGPWSSDPDPAELLEFHPTWHLVPAVANRRIYGIDASHVERPGPRLVAGIRQMAEKLHDDLFPPESTTSQRARAAVLSGGEASL